LEEVLGQYSEVKLHKNNLLLVTVREKIIQALIRRRNGLKAVLSQKAKEMTQDQKRRIKEEAENNLKKQICYFTSVKNVMEKVDLPEEFWVDTLENMIRDVENVSV